MKELEKYYRKIYKHTEKLLQKVFGFDVVSSMKEFVELKKEIEKKTGKPISKTTSDDLIKNKMSYDYIKYQTLDKILSVLSGASFISSFCDDDIDLVKK